MKATAPGLPSVLSFAAVSLGLLGLGGCTRGQAEPQTPQSHSEAEPEGPELTEVREFRESIADRRLLVERTEASTVGRALVTAAEGFYDDHRQALHEAFSGSLAELEDAAPPNATNARMVGSVDAAAPEEAEERRQLALFHLVFSPDVRRQATNAFNAAFVPLAAAQAEMPVSRAGELYGFFSVAQPNYTRCGQSEVCIHYGESDTFVVSFAEIEGGLWTPSGVAWWTTVPPQPPEEQPGPPEEGVGQGTPEAAPTVASPETSSPPREPAPQAPAAKPPAPQPSAPQPSAPQPSAPKSPAAQNAPR